MTGPRPLPDPVRSVPLLVAFIGATVAAFFAMGYTLAGYVYDRYTIREKP